MAGLIFFKTEDLTKIRDFYIGKVGMQLWIDQGSCIILKHDNFLLGFCEGLKESVSPCITFFYKTKKEVDDMYLLIKGNATSLPVTNKKFNIYHFWAKDFEDRTLEFQCFLSKLPKI